MLSRFTTDDCYLVSPRLHHFTCVLPGEAATTSADSPHLLGGHYFALTKVKNNTRATEVPQ
ncbi:hypothetical protein FQA47_023889 [Oryzias melastigma]|uniref:Uncharacterized protein n=1 Tax=Oryzias melastigma TaxID=30732 RepID=A0A834EZ97_ORYME|nr:hypothetical protein FQA47_023889 [Oryzias melastigma]